MLLQLTLSFERPWLHVSSIRYVSILAIATAVYSFVHANSFPILPLRALLRSQETNVAEYFSSISNFDGMEISMDALLSVVPQTLSSWQPGANDQTCLVMFFSDGNREKRAKSFIREMEHQSVIISLPCSLLLCFSAKGCLVR